MISNVIVTYMGKSLFSLNWENDKTTAVYTLKNLYDTKKFLFKTKAHHVVIRMKDCRKPFFLLEDEDNQILSTDRVIYLEGTTNFRDLGGYLTLSGQHVKWGMLFRSDDFCHITIKDKEILNKIGIKTIIDYRSKNEYDKQKDKKWRTLKNTFHLVPKAYLASESGNTKEKVEHVIQRRSANKKIFDTTGKDMIEQAKDFVRLKENKKIFRNTIDIILKDCNTPIVQHCRGGKDRTGYATAIILYLLGVGLDTIVDDYMLTGVLRSQRNKKRMQQYSEITNDKNVLSYLHSMMETRPEYIIASFQEMINISGSINNYFKEELKVTASEVNLLRRTYLL